jgi:hypothetical protein
MQLDEPRKRSAVRLSRCDYDEVANRFYAVIVGNAKYAGAFPILKFTTNNSAAGEAMIWKRRSDS